MNREERKKTKGRELNLKEEEGQKKREKQGKCEKQ